MTTTDLIIIDSSSQIEPPCIVYIYHEIYLQNWLIYGVNVGKYSSTMLRIWASTHIHCLGTLRYTEKWIVSLGKFLRVATGC